MEVIKRRIYERKHIRDKTQKPGPHPRVAAEIWRNTSAAEFPLRSMGCQSQARLTCLEQQCQKEELTYPAVKISRYSVSLGTFKSPS